MEERRYAQTNLQLYAELREAGWSATDLSRARACYELAQLLFSAQFRASGKPFLCHLVGTASVLLRHGAAPTTVCTGIVHAAFMRGDFGARRKPACREMVREKVGADIELLAWHYARYDWPRAELNVEDPMTREVILIRVANEVEEQLDLAALYGSPARLMHSTRLMDRGIEAADAVGHEPLATELRSLRAAQDSAEVPEALTRGLKNTSYTLTPLSYRRRIEVAVGRKLFRAVRR